MVRNYAQIAAAGYDDALAGARALAESVVAFLEQPSAEGLNQARTSWVEARVPYSQTEAFRFYDGPIETVEGLINAWPIDENLIDYVEGEPEPGSSTTPTGFPDRCRPDRVAQREGRREEHHRGVPRDRISPLGTGSQRAGPRRPFIHRLPGFGLSACRQTTRVLRLASRLLVRNLESVAAEWTADSASNYRARFIAMPVDEALASILKGIGILSGAELAGERLTVPYETKEQEDEHSCFSDNTHNDLVYDALGIENVIAGRYVRRMASASRVPGSAS